MYPIGNRTSRFISFTIKQVFILVNQNIWTIVGVNSGVCTPGAKPLFSGGVYWLEICHGRHDLVTPENLTRYEPTGTPALSTVITIDADGNDVSCFVSIRNFRQSSPLKMICRTMVPVDSLRLIHTRCGQKFPVS